MASSIAAEALANATSGAVGSVISKFLSYPMDLLKVKMSVKLPNETFGSVVASMQRQGGLRAFYVGLSPKLVRSGAQKFVYFYIYGALVQLYTRWKGVARLGVATNLFLGVLADWLSAPIIVPLDLVTTQRQTTKGESTGTIVARIYRSRGVAGFYTGCTGYMSGSIQPACQFTIYDQIRHLYLRMVSVPGGELSASAAFLLGAGSRMLSELLTYPTMVVQNVQMATGERWSDISGKSIGGILAGLYKQGGIPALSLLRLIGLCSAES